LPSIVHCSRLRKIDIGFSSMSQYFVTGVSADEKLASPPVAENPQFLARCQKTASSIDAISNRWAPASFR